MSTDTTKKQQRIFFTIVVVVGKSDIQQSTSENKMMKHQTNEGTIHTDTDALLREA